MMRFFQTFGFFIVCVLVGSVVYGQGDVLATARLLIQDGKVEKAISKLEALDLASDASGEIRRMLAIAYFLDGNIKKGEPLAADYLAMEKSSTLRDGARVEFGRALMSAEVDRGQAKKKMRKARVESAIAYYRAVLDSDGPYAHPTRLNLASALMLYAARPEFGLHRDRSAKVFHEAHKLLHTFLGDEPAGEDAMAAKFLLCGHLDCEPLPLVESASNKQVKERPESGTILPVDAGVEAPIKVSTPAPEYTPDARRARIEGQVVLQAIISKQGKVVQVKALAGLPYGLTEAAAETVKKWTFKPAIKNGAPVDVYYNLAINFRLK